MKLFMPMNPKDLDDWAKVEKLLDDENWILQLKKDGVRGIIQITPTGCRIFGRKAGKKDKSKPLEMTHNLPTLANTILPQFLHGWALDCEIYCPGKTSAEISGAVNPNRVAEPVDYEPDIEYWVFDCPVIREQENPFNQKQRLFLLDVIFNAKSFNPAPHDNPYPLRLVETIINNKRESLNQWLNRGEEGGVLKRKDSPYLFSYDTEGKRSANHWVKAKKAFDGDFVITGVQPPEKYYTGKNLESWQYWETDMGHKYYGDRRGSKDKPLTKFAYYDWIGAIEYGLWMSEDDFKLYFSKNKDMKIRDSLKVKKLILASIGTTSGFNEELRMKISMEPSKYIKQVVKISGMEQFPDSLSVRHPSVDCIRWDKTSKRCEI